jgi:integrase
MLTDTKLKNLKSTDKLYKVSDRDGLYVVVSPGGTISFRYDYRINGRRETLTIGKYGRDGISLADARNLLYEAKRLVEQGESPAAKKRQNKNITNKSPLFDTMAAEWLASVRIADSTRSMRQSIIDRDIFPVFGKRLLREITTMEIRTVCEKIVDRGAPSTALFARDIISNIFKYAADKGHEIANPVEKLKASSLATLKPRDRALTPKEIGTFFKVLEHTGTMPSIRLATKFVLLTMVRKNEFLLAEWDEIDFQNMLWTIPAERMKLRRPHLVFLSKQAMDILITFKVLYGETKYLIPGRYSSALPLSDCALNRVITAAVTRAEKLGTPIEHFSVHDLRRTASTLLHEAGFNSDWIEKQLAHEQRGVRAVYNKAEYADQRRDMLQQWADMVDGWIIGINKNA